MTPSFKVELAPRAFADLSGIRDYLIQRSPTGAENVRTAFIATLERLSRHPLIGRNRPELRVRAIGVPRYTYTIYYRIVGDFVQIVHVRDDRRSPLRPGEV